MSYTPMRNDRRDFDPMGTDWGYILDESPLTQWRELVAVNARRATWPFALSSDKHGSYGSVRLSPDWCYCSWSPEYVLAWWDADKPHIVRCDLTIGRHYPNGFYWAPSDKWAGTMVLDLREQTQTWCLRDRDKPVPDDVAAEAAHKGAKLLAFFAGACEHWRAGDQPRPVQAHDLYDPDYRAAS